MPLRIAVLGSGPAGLLAAEAAGGCGHSVRIFSRSPWLSPITGAQYIHQAIPGVTSDEPDYQVHYHKVGTKYGYAEKVYGDPDATCSWDLFPTGEHPAWSMHQIYQDLFEKWGDKITEADIDAEWLDYLESKPDMFQLVISAIPAPVLCANPDHEFKGAKVWFESHEHADQNLGSNYIYYSGDPNDPWYRSSYIDGTGWWEYGEEAFDRIEEFDAPMTARPRRGWEGIKPLDTDCDCRPRIVRAGRFGEWKKGRLVHHAYFKTLDALEVTARALH